MAPTCLSSLTGAAAAVHIIKRPRQPKVTTNSATSGSQACGTASTATTSRRAWLGLAATVVVHHLSSGAAGASFKEPENNGWWVTEFPLPVPTVVNKIANEETGTRSFLRNGIFRAEIAPINYPFRLKHYAFDLLALEDLLGKNASNYVRKYLCLKATVMYYDFDDLISVAAAEEKQPLTDLANRLFDSLEKFESAVKAKDDPLISSTYADTKGILQEVMVRMA